MQDDQDKNKNTYILFTSLDLVFHTENLGFQRHYFDEITLFSEFLFLQNV